jgi:hypothetical protein
MIRQLIAAAAVVLIVSHAAHADIDDVFRVNKLLKLCDQPAGQKTPIQGIDAAICLGYISGILETFEMLQNICVPKLTESINPMSPIIRYLHTHSEMREWLAPIAILTAGQSIYPCAKP